MPRSEPGSNLTAETRLEVIARQVLGVRLIVERQRALIADHKAKGRDTEMAERLLEQFESALAIFEQELEEVPPKSN